MPMTKRLGAYADIEAAFKAVLAHGGGRLTFDTPGAARNWRQRAYYYRQLLGTTKPEYDAFQLHHAVNVVEISLVRLNAKFTTPNGEAVTINVETDLPHDCAPDLADNPLLADALSLVRTNET